MRTGNRRPHPRFAGDCELNAGRPRRGAIIGTAALAEINDADKAKRMQYCVVETTTAADVGDTQRNMIQHNVRSQTNALRVRSANSHKLDSSAAGAYARRHYHSAIAMQ